MRRGSAGRRLGALWVLVLLLPIPWAWADEGPPTVHYAEAHGVHAAGLFGAGIEPVDLATVPFVPNASYPRLQLLLDYDPSALEVDAGPLHVDLLYEFRVDVRDTHTSEVVASHSFIGPGTRWVLLDEARLDGRTFEADIVLRVGAGVEWWFSVYGWRAPIPI